MSWPDRIESYETLTGFPKSLFIAADGRVVGTWIMGNNYQIKSKFHGGYPPTYLKRVKALFPDMIQPLHLFSGRVDVAEFPGDTVDSNPDLAPTFLDDAQTLTTVPLERYDIILSDPPYSVEDSEHYGCCMVNRRRVFGALHRMRRGAWLIWLDQVWPIYSKEIFSFEAAIGVVKSTNHRFRMVTVFRRL